LESGSEINAKDIDLFICMQLLDTSLKSISNQTIINCFRKAKFEFNSDSSQITTQIETVTEEESDFWENLRNLTSIEFNLFEHFVSIDDNESIEFETDLTNEQIIQQITDDNSRKIIEISEEELDDTQVYPIITTSQALGYVTNLKKFFCQTDDNSCSEQLFQIQKRITENNFKRLKQLKITQFLNLN